MSEAIPTAYAGVNFRSRLEAKWAAFFDLAGWRWNYEPLDLGGYIPDFVLGFPQPLLVEVKPLLWGPDDQEPELAAMEKILLSGWRGESLIVGAGLRHLGRHGEIAALGDLLSNGGDVSPAYPWACWYCGELSLTHIWRSYDQENAGRFVCRRSGCRSDPDSTRPTGTSKWDPEPIWREAGNRVQWRPR